MLSSLNADTVNDYAKRGLLNKQDLVEWCLIASKNHLSLQWSIEESYHLRSGVKFAYWQVCSHPRILNDEE